MVVEADDTALGQQLIHDDHVQVQYADRPAGEGITPSGLFVQHSTELPAIFGTILSVGKTAYKAGYRKGAFVFFIRYAGEPTDVLPDGRTFAVFHFQDIPARIHL